jgi:hypothetical protein
MKQDNLCDKLKMYLKSGGLFTREIADEECITICLKQKSGYDLGCDLYRSDITRSEPYEGWME